MFRKVFGFFSHAPSTHIQPTPLTTCILLIWSFRWAFVLVAYLHSSQSNSFSGLSQKLHFSGWISLAFVCKDLLHVLQIYCFPPFSPCTVRLCLMIEVAANFFLLNSHSKTCANWRRVTGPVVLHFRKGIFHICAFSGI